MSSTSPSTSPTSLSVPAYSTSPPRTPVDYKQRPSSATPSSDESIDDLSFDYVFDSDGNYIRLSKGSSSKSNQSSPPTPQDSLSAPIHQPDPPLKPSTPPMTRRASLSRSESAYPVLVTTTASDVPAPRSFQRVASGPALSNNKTRPFPRRVAIEEKARLPARITRAADALQHEKENLITSDSEQNIDVLHPTRALPIRAGGYSRSGPLTDPHQRQIMPGPNKAGRVMKTSVSASTASRFASGLDYGIPESRYTGAGSAEENADETEPDDPPRPSSTPFPSTENLPEVIAIPSIDLVEPESVPLPSSATIQSRSYAALPGSNSARNTAAPREVPLNLSSKTRPRRSASLSDALNLHDIPHGSHYQQQQQQQLREQYQNMKLAADNTGGARRVLLDDKEPQNNYRRDPEEVERRQAELDQHYDSQYHNPSPPLLTQRPSYGHKRRDSDTLRSMPTSKTLGSPTLLNTVSTTRVGRTSPSGANVGRVSPPAKVSPPGTRIIGRVSPPGSRAGVGRSSPPGATLGRISPAPASALATHRRSPTAPEAVPLRRTATERPPASKNWAGAGDVSDDYEYNAFERERERDGRRSQQAQQMAHRAQQMQIQQQQQQYALPAHRELIVNKKKYSRLDCIGKGGSSRVYRVLDASQHLYAVKRVTLDNTDSETMNGYLNELALLKRLEGNSRIIRLIDSEVKPGARGSKGYLMLVMEMGEVDLARLISERSTEPLNMVWVAYYWQQMLQAVHIIHEEKIVHSDLKPANFVLVRGQLKLIDFGIANAIANDTTNIQRDGQVGTVNYMSPEAIELPDGKRRLKVGRPSDVWSLGCILYLMVYGQPPFQHLSVYQKVKAIPDLNHVIDFPEFSIPNAPMPVPNSNGGPPVMQTKRLDHLKKPVRSDVIASMKRCLCRGPKERATIPELLEQEWLDMKEPQPPAMKDLLAPDETVISPYYMRQLLQYGIKLGEAQNTDMSPEGLLREAERLVAELKAIQP